MKRSLYYILMVLFILSACVPIPQSLGQAATASQSALLPSPSDEPSRVPEPTPTPTEKTADSIIINNEFKRDMYCEYKHYSRVSLTDIINGKTLPYEKAWLDQHPFSKSTVPISKLKINSYHFEREVVDYSDANLKYIYFEGNPNSDSNPNNRPFKIISFYVFYDKDILSEMLEIKNHPFLQHCVNDYKSSYFGIMAWAWLNPNGTTAIGHSLFEFVTFENDVVIPYSSSSKDNYNRIIFPIIYSSNVHLNDPYKLLITPEYVLPMIYKRYPQISPFESAKKWVNTKNIPLETETKLFGTFLNLVAKW